MQMILEGRVDRLENLIAEVIELCRELKTDAAERDRVFSEHIRQEKEEMDAFRQEMAAIKLDAVERDRKFEDYTRQEKEGQLERDRKFEEWLKQDKEEREEEREASDKTLNKTGADIACECYHF